MSCFDRMLVGVTVMAGVSSSALAVPIVSRDFEADTVGGLPQPNDASNLYASPGVRLEVIDSASTPADPFGGAGNQSLLWEIAETGNGSSYVMSAPSANALTTGIFSTKFYHSSTGAVGSPLTIITLGAFNSTFPGAATYGPDITFNGDGNIIMNINGSSNPIDQSVSFDTVHTLTINFDTTTDTYTGTLDGNPLTDNGGATTTFPFTSALSGIYAIEINTPTSSRTGRVFVDDVTLDVIPEPASGIAALGLAGCFALRRRASGRT